MQCLLITGKMIMNIIFRVRLGLLAPPFVLLLFHKLLIPSAPQICHLKTIVWTKANTVHFPEPFLVFDEALFASSWHISATNVCCKCTNFMFISSSGVLALVGLSIWMSLSQTVMDNAKSYTLPMFYLNKPFSSTYLVISFRGPLPWKWYQNKICLTLGPQPEMEERNEYYGRFHSWETFSVPLRERGSIFWSHLWATNIHSTHYSPGVCCGCNIMAGKSMCWHPQLNLEQYEPCM